MKHKKNKAFSVLCRYLEFIKVGSCILKKVWFTSFLNKNFTIKYQQCKAKKSQNLQYKKKKNAYLSNQKYCDRFLSW